MLLDMLQHYILILQVLVLSLLGLLQTWDHSQKPRADMAEPS